MALPKVATRPGRSWRADLAVLAVCAGTAIYLMWGMWQDPTQRVIKHNQGDQSLFEWLLGYAAHAVTHPSNPLWTTLLNYPMGVNLSVNTSEVVVGGLLAPLTLTLGAPVTYLVVLTVNLIATPFAWYFVLSRHLVRTRAAAVLGGLFCGYAPGMISHAEGHLNFTGQFLVPFLVWRVLKLAEPGRAVRNGILAGILVVLQFSISAELLFFLAMAMAVFLGCWAWLRRDEARTALPAFGKGLAVTAGFSVIFLGYPLWLQFAGPQRYKGIGFLQWIHNEDLLAFGAFPYLSQYRRIGLWFRLAPNFTEETTFYGPLLLAMVIGCFIWLRRQAVVRALAVTSIVFAVTALGPRLKVGNHTTRFRLPYAALANLPVFDSALPARFSLLLIPIFGVLLAFAVDRIQEQDFPVRRRRWFAAALALSLLPLLPNGIPAARRDPVPTFFSSGDYRRYLPAGKTLVPVPPASDLLQDGQRWQVATKFTFAIPSGFFLGPGGPDDRSRIGPVPRPTADRLTNIALFGRRADIDWTVNDVDRAQARADLSYWNAGLIVLSDGGEGSRWTPYGDLLLQDATALFGPPTRVDDVWIWPVGP